MMFKSDVYSYNFWPFGFVFLQPQILFLELRSPRSMVGPVGVLLKSLGKSEFWIFLFGGLYANITCKSCLSVIRFIATVSIWSVGGNIITLGFRFFLISIATPLSESFRCISVILAMSILCRDRNSAIKPFGF